MAKMSKTRAAKSSAGKSRARPPLGTKPRSRQRIAKGRRPFFMKDPDVDRLLAMVMALTGEVSVLRDRLDTHERLAREGKVASPDNIETYEPSAGVEDERERARAAMLSRVFRILELEMETGPAAETGYRKLIATFAKR